MEEDFADPSRRQEYFEYATGVLMYSWQVLATAVQEEWAGPDSGDIRDWMGGVVVDMFAEGAADVESVEDRLVQIMADEFHAELEDDSAFVLARHICQVWQECAVGNFASVRQLYMLHHGSKSIPSLQMQAAAAAAEPGRERQTAAEGPAEPSVDEDGFTIVRRRR